MVAHSMSGNAGDDIDGIDGRYLGVRQTLLVLAIGGFSLLAFVALLVVAPLSQAKVVVGAFGSAGIQGGQFAGTGKIAINNSGAGGVPAGTVYVADPGNNRVQRLSPNGAFERTWGFDVDASNPSAGFEICTVAADCQKGITAATTANGGLLSGNEGIDVNQTTGHVYVIDNGNRRVQEFDANGSFVRAWGADVLVGGVTTFEICDVAAECKSAAAGGASGGQLGNNPRSLRLDSTGNVWVADTANRRLQKFDSTGNFIAAYGFNVNSGGILESCSSTATGVCKAGTAGSGPGQFNGFSPFHFDFDSTGNLLANNGGNQRIERFDPALTTATTFASLSILDNTGAILSLPGDHLLVTQNQSGERQLVELDESGGVVETSLAGIGLTSINGLARRSTTGRVYAITNNSQAKVLMIEDGSNPPPPGMTVDPIMTKTATTASFSGTIDPQGATISSCSFEYSTSESFASGVSAVSVSDCPSLEPGGGVQAVSANASGLVPNTKYFVRLAVNRLFIAGTAASGVQSFTTDLTSPTVSNVGAVQVDDTSAQLVGTINPNNSGNLGYVFQYGTTPALGSSTAPAPVADGNSPMVVSQSVSGLDPGATYFVKLVATNLTGSGSAASVFTTRSEPFPSPPNRAYEMVSPPDKSGGGALSGGKLVTVAEDGQAIQYNTTSLFGEPSGVQTERTAPYVSQRTASGWQTLAATPGACRAGALEDPTAQVGVTQWGMFSPNLDMSVFLQPESSGCAIPPLSNSAPLPAQNLYRHEIGNPSSYELLTPAPAFAHVWSPFIPSGWGGYPVGFSSDFNHVVYESTGNQTPDAPPAGNFNKIYEWDSGVLRLVSKDIGNNPFSTDSWVPIEGDGNRQGENPVSSDGRRIFFQNPTTLTGACSSNPGCELYMREDGSTTHDISQSECTSSCGADQADSFTWASPDGSKALFTSAAKLTDDTNSTSGANLYMFTLGADPAAEPHNLAQLSRDLEPADGLKAEVRDVIGAGDDGTVVYFVANGQIVLGASTASGPKVYRWSWNGGTPTVDYLATLNGGEWSPPEKEIVDSLTWTEPAAFVNSGFDNEGRIAYERVTPDGKYVLVSTIESLEPVSDTDSTADLYRWSQVGGWVCVTCQAPGTASAGSSIGPGPGLGAKIGRRMIAMSDDGRQIFFVTRDRLVPEDMNGSARDVYEWYDGTISLLSSGTDARDVSLLGASHNGEDVFIYTEQRLVGWDGDNTGDIYDVRTDGGFPEPPLPEPVCEGDACRVAAPQPPALGSAGTAAFEGPGNTTGPVTCPRGTKRTVTKAGATICKKVTKRKHKRKKRHHQADRGRGAAR